MDDLDEFTEQRIKRMTHTEKAREVWADLLETIDNINESLLMLTQKTMTLEKCILAQEKRIRALEEAVRGSNPDQGEAGENQRTGSGTS